MVHASAPVVRHITNVDYQTMKSTFLRLSFQMQKKGHFCFQEGGSRELLADQPHLDSQEHDGAANPRNHFHIYEGQEKSLGVVSLASSRGSHAWPAC